ncbi:copper resistance CopC/CopD family protein [Mesorhizobium marinum]|uniref:Copper resistance CopC/CopD family protein n=1 Tax=Mesorhizobium marinum TaxID=3228790 RepID=A0ABV3QZ78_9HYPH
MLLLALAAGAGPAAAHASLNASDPPDGAVVEAAPKSLLLTFSEPVSPLSLTLVRPDGSSIALTGFALRDRSVEIATPDDLGQGTHVLSWRVVSADGHPVGGAVVFSIGEASAEAPMVDDSVDWMVRFALWASRIALYVGLLLGIGGVFSLRVLMPGIASGRNVAGAALAVGIVGAFLSAGFQGLDALGAPISRLGERLVWSTGFGTSYGDTVLAALAASGLAALALARSGPAATVAASLALLGAGLSLALSGHASAASPQWLMRPMVFLHAAAVAAWAGALAPLGLAFLRREPGRAVALARFSRTIPAVVGVLAVAGLVLALVQVERLAALFETDYGAVLCAKLLLLAGLFSLAAVNRWSLTRRAGAGEAVTERRLVASIVAETLLVLVVLAAVAAWRFTPPPRVLFAQAAAPVTEYIHTEKALAYIQFAPGRAGRVDASVNILTGDFEKLDAKEVTLVLSNPKVGIEPFKRALARRGEANWRADVDIPIAGLWRVRVDVLVSDFEIVRLEGQVRIAP